MDKNVLRHPRSFVRNANNINSGNTPCNMYNMNLNNDSANKNNGYNLNQNLDIDQHGVPCNTNTNSSFSNMVYNNREQNIDTSENMYRTGQNTERNMYDVQNIFNSSETNLNRSVQDMYNTTDQNYIQKPKDNYATNYCAKNDGADMYPSLNTTDQSYIQKPKDNYATRYCEKNDEADMYSNLLGGYMGNNYVMDNQSNHNSSMWKSSSSSMDASAQNHNQDLSSLWNSASNSLEDCSQNSISNQYMQTFRNTESNTIHNSPLEHMSIYEESNVGMFSSNSNQELSFKDEESNEDIDHLSYNIGNDHPNLHDTQINKTSYTRKKVHKQNTNYSKYSNSGIEHNMRDTEQNYIDNTDTMDSADNNIDYNEYPDDDVDDEEEDDYADNLNFFSNDSIEKERSEMIVILSLLQDMVTAIEITESTRVMYSSSKSMERKSVITSESKNKDNNFQDHKVSEDVEENEGMSTQKEHNIQNMQTYRFPSNNNDDLNNEESFEELTDESEEFEHQSVQDSRNSKVKRKTFNQRKNIRNVFQDKQLDAKTQLLREKEKERLQRLGLKQSIENTGKMLRAHVKKTVVEKKDKKDEVICLDSDSDEDYQARWASKAKTAGKEPILVLSSDSEEGEDGGGPVFDELIQSENYYSELGLHTNDSLNVCSSNNKVLVNVNHNKDDDDIFLHPSIGNNLKPHQIGGVRFLYDNLIESVAHFRPEEGNGCILAHAMGLGKTIQTITFIDLFLRYTSAKKVLCVVPVNTIQNWMNEFNRWLPGKQDDFNICDYVPKVSVPKVSAQKSKKTKLSKKEEEDAAIIQDLLEDMVEYVMDKQLTSDVSDVVNEVLNSVCKDEEQEKCKKPSPPDKNDCDGYRNFHVFLIDAHKNLVERAKIIEEWDKCGGVLLAGYEMYRSIAMYKVMTKVKGKMKKGKRLTDENGDVLLRLKKIICKPGPDLVVCDEGHRIRNYQSGISQALKSIKTRKRLVLTGYPLQNNLIEYWCMVDFVRPNYLGSRQEFSNMFERPIMNGQCVDSTPKDKHLMKQRAHVLYSLLQGFVQRRGHDVFSEILPRKEEHVLMIRLSPIQKALYNRLMELTRDAYHDSLNPVKTFSLCCKIWNHPDILYDAIQMSEEGKKVDIIGDEDDIALDDSGGRQKRKRKQPSCLSPVPNSLLMSNIGFDPFGTEAKDLLTDIAQWAAPIFKKFPYTPGGIENSGKFIVLNGILNQTLHCGDKMLLFSQSLLTLNAIEKMLQNNYKNVDGTFWRKGRDYYRLDGGTNSLEREKMINAFNDEKNMETKLFILSTRAGCLGINLVAANRVVVFDVSWNPCHDAQAVCRIYRYGQKKSCHIYRLVSSNTMEKKIYYRQLSKQGISDRVVDEANLTENFSKNEIQSLVIEDWVDEPFPDFSTSAFSFDDPVLVNALYTSSQWITKVPFQHESLLINESSQKLSGSEKRAAKREYEQERMMVHGSVASSRPCPLQQNFPRNTPIAPVRPFLWRPPLTTSWLHNPSTLFHHTVSHNVTVPSSFPSNDPLQILRNGAYTGDHSYSGTDISTPLDVNSSADYWRNLDSQISSTRLSPSNITNVLARNRSLLHIGSHNNPLARLTQSATGHTTSSTSSSNNQTPIISSVFAPVTLETTVVNATYPLTHTTTSSVVQNVLVFRRNEEKARREASLPEQTNDGLDSPIFYPEQSEESSDFFDSNSAGNDTVSRESQQNGSNFEVIVLDDDEDD